MVGIFLSSCASYSDRAEHVQSTPPTITYKYEDDESLIDAVAKAEEYCLQFNSWPTPIESHPDAMPGQVTFICDQNRVIGEAYEALPADPTVDYLYHDHESLVKATIEAQRHCARLGARAHTARVTTIDGSNTVIFD